MPHFNYELCDFDETNQVQLDSQLNLEEQIIPKDFISFIAFNCHP